MAATLSAASCSRMSSPTIRLVSFQGAIDPFLAQSIGTFRDAGLEVQITQVPGTAKAMEALTGGSADVIVGTYEQALQLGKQGRKIGSVYTLDTCHCLALVTLDAKLRQVSDLAGKTIGIAAPGGQMQNFAQFLLRERRIEASFASIGATAAAVAALENGKVDAAVVLYSSYELLRQRHPELQVLAETFTPEGMKQTLGVAAYPSRSVLAEQAWIDGHPNEVKKLRQAFRESVRWMKGHGPAEIYEKLPQEVRSPDPHVDIMLIRLLVPLMSETGELPIGGDQAVRRVLGY